VINAGWYKRYPFEQMRLPGFSAPPIFVDRDDENRDSDHDEQDTKDQYPGNQSQ
jgi:hypothetical protein